MAGLGNAARSLSSTLWNLGLEETEQGVDIPIPEALGRTQRERRGWRGASGWVSRPVGSSRVEVRLSRVGTKSHRSSQLE